MPAVWVFQMRTHKAAKLRVNEDYPFGSEGVTLSE